MVQFRAIPLDRLNCFLIDKKEFDSLLERKDNRELKDRKLFMLFNCKDGKNIYTAIDNMTGDFYVEDFTTMDDALIWLTGLKESEVLKKAEEQEWWW